MAKIKIVLYTSKELSNGENPIMLRVTKLGQRKYISLNQSATEKQWDDIPGRFVCDKRINKDYDIYNEILRNNENRANDIIQEFRKQNIDFTLKAFEDRFKLEQRKQTVVSYFNKQIESLKKQRRFGYAEIFENALKILKLYHNNFESLLFPDIDYKFISGFDFFLRERKVMDTTISVYMRITRTVLLNAINDNIGSKETFCFSDRHGYTGKLYKISKLNVETTKRFIPVEYLQKIKNTKFIEPHFEFTRHLFLFSFYAYGMSFIDMAQLTKNNIKSTVLASGQIVEVIEYIRQKTHKQHVKIIITPEIKDLLQWFKNNHELNNYLVPIVSNPKLKGAELTEHIKNRRKRYGKNLKKLAEKLEFPPDLAKSISSYYSRHSFAMALRNKGTNVELISEALGHKELKTTQIYLDSFGTEAISNATKDLI